MSTIINLAHALKLKVVAEGAETEVQLHLLRWLGCDEMQGFIQRIGAGRYYRYRVFVEFPSPNDEEFPLGHPFQNQIKH